MMQNVQMGDAQRGRLFLPVMAGVVALALVAGAALPLVSPGNAARLAPLPAALGLCGLAAFYAMSTSAVRRAKRSSPAGTGCGAKQGGAWLERTAFLSMATHEIKRPLTSIMF